MIFKRKKIPEVAAAVDLGSNSFHMIVASIADGHIQVVDRLRETVRLGGGLGADGRLDEAAQERALACLARFGQRVQDLPPGAVRAVGTNTLRKARNANDFLRQARKVLGHPIEVIAGREEARLIYLGVAHSLASDEERRLVVDIGGGSTELIIGERFNPEQVESLHMGCVSMTRLFFPDGQITEKAWHQAHTAARLELRPIQKPYRQAQWGAAVGASGTLLAVRRVVIEQGWSEAGITLESLQSLREAMIKAGSSDALNLNGLSKDRAPVFVGGVAVLLAVFEALKIKHMSVSDGALREGLLYDLLGRIKHEDVRSSSVRHLMQRFGVDETHCERVRSSALSMLNDVAPAWELDEDYADILGWAAQLHELGLAIAHSQYHKHGAYILEHADLPGFSRQDQQVLALLVRSHRRKLQFKCFESLPVDTPAKLVRLALLLRLAVLLHRSRSDGEIPILALKAREARLSIRFEPSWLEENPLTFADLSSEVAVMKSAGLKLSFE